MTTRYADSFDTINAVFPWIFGTMLAIILCVAVIVVVTIVRNGRVLRQAGLDPTTAGSQLAVRMLRSRALAEPPASSRLAELGDLRDRGLITPDEYEARRKQIIAEI
jgi:putative oligomerization/nucleic acid binding protein